MKKQSKTKTFKSLEAAQREVDIQIALEGIRKLALAMQTTEEIGSVVMGTRAALIDLGIRPFRTVIALCDESVDSVQAWSAKQSQKFSYSGKGSLLAYRNSGSVLYAPRPKHKYWVMTKLNKRQFTSECRKMRKAAQMSGLALPADWLDRMVGESPSPYYHHNFHFMGGFIGIGLDHELDRGEIAIGRRVAETFGFAYKRLLDLQEKEQRVREAEVEAALERVRSQALAMQDASELGTVTDLMYDEIQALGFNLHWLSLNAVDHSGMRMIWSAGEQHVVRDFRVMTTRQVRSQIWKRAEEELVAARKRGDKTHIIQVQGKQVRTLVTGLLRSQGKSQEDIEALLKALPSTLVSHRVLHEHGLVAFVREQPLDDEQAAIANRFTDVFDFAYKRFLDLQDKERRAREAEVEAALERVRSQALAMETSQDIPAVSAAVFRELNALNFPAGSSLIGIPDEARNLTTQWVVWPDELEGWDIVYKGDVNVALEYFDLKKLYSTHPFNRKAFRASISGQTTYLTHRFQKSELQDVAKRYMELGQWSTEKYEAIAKPDVIPDVSYYSVVQHKHGYLGFWLMAPLKDFEIEEAKRFATTFDFAYDRYLDLQGKERRAREAEVEAALERIRSQALSMQMSEDLPTVAAALYQETKALYADPMGVGISVIGIVNEEADQITQWTVLTEDGSGRWLDDDYVIGDVHVQIEPFGLSALRSLNNYCKKAFGATGGKSVFMSTHYSMAEAIGLVRDITRLRQWSREYGKAVEGHFRSVFKRAGVTELQMGHIQFKQGYFLTFVATPYSDSQIEELKRIGDVFAFAYDRFLDLQQKERRARKAEIEAALERVRARALGMQESGEIMGVATALRNTFEDLGYVLDQTVIRIPDPANKTLLRWIANPTTPRDTEFLEARTAPMDRRQAWVRKWERGEKYWTERVDLGHRIENIKNHMTGMGTSEASKKFRIKALPDPYYDNFVSFGEGLIVFGGGHVFAAEDFEVARRFADVFGVAYRRFRELEQKEEQNHELRVQNSLEHIRARALGMQESEEISEVAVTLWEEFAELGVPIRRPAINLVDLESNSVEIWTTTTEGEPMQVSRFAAEIYGSSPVDAMQNLSDGFQRGDRLPASASFDRDEFEAHLAWMEANLGLVFPNYDRDGISERTVYQAVYFDDGYLLLNTFDKELTGENIEIAQRFANEFGVAYSRFKELKHKEAQNRELTIQNALERVRAQAQGMQESDEISGVTAKLFEEFQGLEFTVSHASVQLIDKENKLVEYWLAALDRSWDTRAPFKVPIDPLLSDGTIEARHAGKTHHTLHFESRRDVDAFRVRLLVARGHTTKVANAFVREKLPRFDYLAVHRVFHTHGLIAFGTPEKWSEDDLAIAKRFTDVFDYAYDRFRELKEKEDQNRELTVQNAIERVRARALGMQESSELDEVSMTLFLALRDVGIERIVSWIEIVDDDASELRGTHQVWDDPKNQLAGFRLPLSETTGENKARFDKVKRWRDGEVAIHQEVHGEDCAAQYRYWESILASSNPGFVTPEPQEHQVGSFYQFDAGMRFGFVGFGRVEPISDEDAQVTIRFADVFEFAYSRFLELKQKEDQNRELTIQNALERVRSRALGMQESRDIGAVVWELFDEVHGLFEDVFSTSIELHHEAAENEGWVAGLTCDRDVTNYFSRDKTAVGPMRNQRTGEARERGQEWVLTEETRKTVQGWVSRVRKNLEAAGLDADQIEARVCQVPFAYVVLEHLERGYNHNGLFEHGAIQYRARRQFGEDELTIVKRFTDLFEFAYSRFRDLKEKEEQARAADQRAAVDRVRAEATAMAGTEDIADVVKALWDGLVGQGFAFSTLVFRVEDEQERELQMYLATLEGASGLAFPESHLLSRGMLEGVNLYRSTMPLGPETSARPVGRGVYSGLSEQQNIDAQALWGFELPAAVLEDSQRLVVPFAYGQISVLREAEPFSEPDIERVEPFAEASSLGFTRYFDFRRLEGQNIALEKANDEVREATRLKSQFLATMSHELRTPMNAIIGFTRLVLRRSDNLEDRQRGNLEKVQLSANHLLTLINDILDLSKVEAGRVDVAPSTFNVPPLLEHCCATVGPTLGKPGVELKCEISEDVGEAFTDESRLRQIVINLLSNALKFTDTGEVNVVAKILESVDPEREAKNSGVAPYIEVAVSDTGIGIPENQREAVFEEFRQVDGTSTRRHQGTGLGLAITKQLIALLGGSIWLDSEVGKGSTFTFQIPVRYSDRAESSGAGDIPGSGAEQQGVGNARTIVSIDDDPNVAVLLRQELEAEGYTVISALNADEGVALVKKHKPAAVTVDILMPGKDGWQTIGMLKGDPETQDIPIIVLSAIEKQIAGFGNGCEGLLDQTCGP